MSEPENPERADHGLASWFQAIGGRTLGAQEDATALGVCRALIAGILFLSAFAHVGSVGDYFSDQSMLNGRFAELAFPSRWSLFFTITEPTAVRVVWAVGVAALGLWCVGLFTRVSAVVGMLLWASMYGRNPLLYAYPDQLGMMLGMLLALMPTGRGFSLDARWRGLGGTVPIWCRRAIQLQVAIMYTATGIEKSGPGWHEDHTAVYYTVLNPYNRHFDMGPLAASIQSWLLKPATIAVRYWETWFWTFLVYHWCYEAVGKRLPAWGERREAGERGWRLPDLRWVFLLFGVGMHIGIQVAVYVLFFSVLCVFTYASFFSSEEMYAIVARGKRLLRRGRSEPDEPAPAPAS